MSLIDETAIIRPGVKIGFNAYVGEYVVLGSIPVHTPINNLGKLKGLVIGNNCSIYAYVGINKGTIRDTIVRDQVIIGNRSSIGHDAFLGNEVKIMPACAILGFVEIGDMSFIGAGSVVRNRIKIGFNCYVGQGSNVVKDIPDNSFGYGNPFKVISNRDGCLKNAAKRVEDWLIHDKKDFV